MLNKINALLGKICVQSRLRYDIAIEVPTVYGKVKFDFERTSTPAMPPLEEAGWLVIRKDAKALAQLIVSCGGTLKLALSVDVNTKHGERRVSCEEVVETIQGTTVNTSKFSGCAGETPIKTTEDAVKVKDIADAIGQRLLPPVTHDKGIRLNPDLFKSSQRDPSIEWDQSNRESYLRAIADAKADGLVKLRLRGLTELAKAEDNYAKEESEAPVIMDRVFVVGAKSELTDLLNSHPGLGAFNETKLTTQEFLDSKPERYVNLVKAVSRRVKLELEQGIDLRGSAYSVKPHLYAEAFLRKGDTVFYPEWAEEGYASGWICVVIN